MRSVILPVNRGRLQNGEDEIAAVLRECEGVPGASVDVAVGCYVWNEHVVQQLLPGLRARGFTGRVILGGPQISFAGAGVDRLYPHADVFVRGYGEQSLCDLVRRAGRARLPGIHYAGEVDDVTQSTVDLGSLPSPWLHEGSSLVGRGFARWETQRGCPFRCSFCQHREAGERLAHLSFASPRIADEARLLATSRLEEIAVLDPIFNASPFAANVLDVFAEHRFAGRLSLQCRAEMLNDRFLDAARAVRTKLELGLQTIHPAEGDAIRRRNHIDRVDAALAGIRQRGIEHEVSLIFGLPEQTYTSFLQSVAWCLERRVPVIKAFPLLLLRGTGLDHGRARWDLVDDGTPMARVVSSSTFSRAEWEAMAQVAEALARTEGAHPRAIGDLIAVARSVRVDEARWQSS